MTTLNKTQKEVDDATALARNKETKKQIYFAWLVGAIIVTILGGLLYGGWHMFGRVHNGPPDCNDKSLAIIRPQAELARGSGYKMDLAYAKTIEEKNRGLSGLPCLPLQTAMVFYFDTPDYYGIWMKDMNFAIDVMWLDAQRKVVHIEKNMTPQSYPKVYKPQAPALFAIEMNVGAIDLQQITVGTTLQW